MVPRPDHFVLQHIPGIATMQTLCWCSFPPWPPSNKTTHKRWRLKWQPTSRVSPSLFHEISVGFAHTHTQGSLMKYTWEMMTKN